MKNWEDIVNSIGRLIIVLIGMSIMIGTSILVMIRGWGLEPQSWWYILGVGITGVFIGRLVIELSTVGIKKG